MRIFPINLPVALITLACWFGMIVIPGWQSLGGVTQSFEHSVAGEVQWNFLMNALFVSLIIVLSNRRRAVGVCKPQLFLTLKLIWPALLCCVMLILFSWIDGWLSGKVTLVVFCNAASVAVSEELMFRGILLTALMTRFAIWPSVLMSSALFGIAHVFNSMGTGDLHGALIQAAAAFLQGIAYAAIRLRSRSVWPMVVVHGLWDFGLVMIILSAARDGEYSILPFAALIIVFPLSLYGVYLLRTSQREIL